MNSFQELNSFSQTSLDVTDNRGSKVVFNRVSPLQPLDIVGTISAITVSVAPGGNEIVDIINYATANTRFRVRITTGGSPALTGSTLNFGTLPAALTLTVSGGTYTISGITTVAQWNTIKYFVWNLPANFASCPLWYLDIAILYYDSARNEEMVIDWEMYDPRFYYIAKLTSQFTQTALVGNKKLVSASLTSVSTLDCPGSRVYRGQAALSASTSVVVNALDLDLASAALTSRFTTQITVYRLLQCSATIGSTSSVIANLTGYKAINNMITRSYQSNTSNLIFATSTPYIEDLNPSNSWTISLSSSDGQFGHSSDLTTAYSTLTYTGNMTNVNNYFSGIIFYPTKDVNYSTTFTYTQNKNGSFQTSKTVNLTNSGTATITPTIYTYNTVGTYTFTPTLLQKKYTLLDFVVIGGGGGGGSGKVLGGVYDGAGGGGGGGYISGVDNSITLSSYAIVVGAGGARGSGATSAGHYGSDGSTSSFYSYSASGGLGGLAYLSSGLPSSAGGDSGNGYSGGNGAHSTTYDSIGGGGGGATGNGTNATFTGIGSGSTGGVGGNGYVNSITGTSVIYGRGGHGGNLAINSDTIYTTPGSGGSGSWTATGVNGQTGIVIIKLHG